MTYERAGVTLHCADSRVLLPLLPSGHFDAVICDPPYPHIVRPYGTWTEAEWFDMMRTVVPECMRVLKPSGSAVFILQPNSERVGRMRTWLWEFMLWVGKEWGIVQDVWWWNNAALPLAGSNRMGLMRPSLKACVWVGPSDCWRNQSEVLERESNRNRQAREEAWNGTHDFPCGISLKRERMHVAAAALGGVTPFNVLQIPNTDSTNSAGSEGHGAGTPSALCSWWLRYICPPAGRCLDPFSGVASVALAALKQGKEVIGIEVQTEYHTTACKRIDRAVEEFALFEHEPIVAKVEEPTLFS